MIPQYLLQSAYLIEQLDVAQINSTIDRLRIIRQDGGRLFFAGNGGGAAHASHAAADFRKIANIESYAWGDNTADLTAYTNDYTWEAAVASWLQDSRACARDGLILFSVGGSSRTTSANLKEAVFWAKGGPTIIGVVGATGGYIAQHADHVIVIPSFSTPHVEGIQAVVWHLLVTALAC